MFLVDLILSFWFCLAVGVTKLPPQDGAKTSTDFAGGQWHCHSKNGTKMSRDFARETSPEGFEPSAPSLGEKCSVQTELRALWFTDSIGVSVFILLRKALLPPLQGLLCCLLAQTALIAWQLLRQKVPKKSPKKKPEWRMKPLFRPACLQACAGQSA